LISCDQYVQRLRGATDLEGVLHKDFDDWFSKAIVDVEWPGKKSEGKTVDPAKKIAKSDLYDAILAEIQAIGTLLEDLEVKVKKHHKDFVRRISNNLEFKLH
jgi:hypothetical protein